MLPAIRRRLAQYLTSAGHLLLLLIAFEIHDRAAWLVSLSLIAGISAIAWLANLRRYRAIADTPTSRIGSAAQGFVELSGIGKPLPDTTVLSPARHLPCLWYRYKAYERRGDDWTLVESGESDAEFLLDDGSGLCLLRPCDAEVTSDRKDTYTQDGIRHEEEVLLPGERLYALGEFVSRGGAREQFDSRGELDRLLTEWKQDADDLKRRFDLDGSGAIEPAEWSLALSAARREVDKRRREALASPALHGLDKPGHGRPYLIANFMPERLAGHYRFWAWAHAAMMLAASLGLGFVPG